MIYINFRYVLVLIMIVSMAANARENPENTDDSTRVSTVSVKPWHRYENKYFSTGPLVALVMDVTKFEQDDASLQQVGNQNDLYEPGQIRAIRLGFAGTIKLRRPWKYMFTVGYRAFDVGFDTDSAATFTVFDLRADIPTNIGTFALGYMKEPISMQRIMPGAYLLGIERPMNLDALLPARNIGIQWYNSFFNKRTTLAAGWFNNWLQSGVAFKDNSNQFIGRFTVLPLAGAKNPHIVHLGISYRYSTFKVGGRAKATPEAFFSSNYVDTGVFSGESTTVLGLEGSWKYRQFWVNSEYVGANIKSKSVNDPFFSGFHVGAAWALTGEERPYIPDTGLFAPIVPRRNVHTGGTGAIELMARYTKIDLDSGNINGGAMNRWSLGFNWYPTLLSRFSVHYGYVTLNRFNLSGKTHILQTRLILIIG
jgi:phosphate-selective porin OprO/OprP